MNRLLAVLASGRTLLMDGAMGTELMRRGYRGPTWRANFDAPDLVYAIHADYLAAGAEVLLSNTFLANDQPTEVARAALGLARTLPGSPLVLASLGPVKTRAGQPDFPEPDALPGLDLLAEADGILLETCSDASAFAVARSVRSRFPELAVLVSFTYRGDPATTFAGHSPESLALQAEDAGVSVLGVNCGLEQTPAMCGEVLRRYRSVTRRPLLVRPNAAEPAEAWAQRVARLREATLIGGCCGTTPDHIRALLAQRSGD